MWRHRHKTWALARISPIVGLVLAIGCWSPPVLGQPASFIPLGDLPGGTFRSDAFGISRDGTVVVGSSIGYPDTFAGNQAFRWKDGVMSGLGDLPGGFWGSDAYGVSSDGKYIVGRSNSDRNWEAMIWSAPTGMIGLGHLPGRDSTVATGVSQAGDVVVGHGWTIGTPGLESFRWTSSQGMVSLGHLPGAVVPWTIARGVSADGRAIVGSSYSSMGRQAYRWTTESGMVALPGLPGQTASFDTAHAISSDAAWIVGESNGPTGPRAVMWSAGGGVVSLGSLSPTGQSRALGVSDDGTVVVGAAYTSQFSGDRAFVWTAAAGMRRIDSVLSEAGVDLAGWYLISAEDVSGDGRLIVGTGRNPDGNVEGWVASIPIPAPAPMALLATGVLALTPRRRR